MSALDRGEGAVVGRDAELEAVRRWLDAPRPALLQVEGEAGIGKSTIWEAAAAAARERGARVLACRPVEIEATVAYGALASLLERELAGVEVEVPLPRLRALEGALRLRDVPESRLDETGVALGLLSVLRALAARQPVALAVEDVQWLDSSSRGTLAYALRNLRAGDDVAVLLTRRTPGAALGLTNSELAAGEERLSLGPLSIGALHRMIRSRFGTPLSRPKLARVHELSRGNPLYALELARVIALSEPGDAAIALPDSLGAALRARTDALAQPTREVLLVLAAAGEARPRLLADALESAGIGDALEEATRHGIVAGDGGRVRFTHPLLASTVYGAASAIERQAIHARLGRVAETAEERARHLALSGSGPDEAVASALVSAAEQACSRGARGAGAALYEQAAALTDPEDAEARARRIVLAADAHFQAGDSERARTLLEEVVAGATRVRFEALSLLGMLLDETVGGSASLASFEAALATDDAGLAADVHRRLAQVLVYVGDGDRALEHADAAVAGAETLADRSVLAYALSMQALVQKIAAHPGWRESLERALELEARLGLAELDVCPSAVEADTRRLSYELDAGRTAYERLLGRASDLGDVRAESWCRFGLAVLELLAGRLAAAAEQVEELTNLAEQTSLMRLPALRAAGHLAVLRGDVRRARALLDAVAAEAEPAGELLNLRAVLQLRGLLELSLGDAESALEPLGRARLIAQETAVGEPAMLAFQLDEVEALAATGDAAAARAVLDGFEARSDGSPWVEPLLLRSRGVVQAAAGELEAARGALESAIAAGDRLPLPLERARTMLALGRVLRRLQQRTAAQATLREALERFEGIGAVLWADRAREELARIGGRAGSRDELTATERQIAELVAEGRTNREVGSLLFVTPKTVESALTRIYRKLGVRSRTELARRL
jgi:DNA-binding CsgD family transcriptional regulator